VFFRILMLGGCAAALALGLIVPSVAGTVAPVASPSAAVSPELLYHAALAKMRTLRQPDYLSYRVDVPAGKTTAQVTRESDGRALIGMGISTNTYPAQHWFISYRGSDGLLSIALDDGSHAISEQAFFDPSWRGVYRWMRDGFSPWPSPSPRASPSIAPSPAASALPLIAVVSAMSSAYYRIEDAGAQACSDGRPGRALRTIARTDPERHPLVGVVIDSNTMEFCSLRFDGHGGNPAFGYKFGIELHLSPVGPYYLVTDGILDGSVHAMLVPLHSETRFAYSEFAFPTSLPDALFTPQPIATR
jgi:hypothetical protein